MEKIQLQFVMRDFLVVVKDVRKGLYVIRKQKSLSRYLITKNIGRSRRCICLELGWLLLVEKPKSGLKNIRDFLPVMGINQDGTVQTRWTDDELQRMLGIYRKPKVPCSCYMCGNPRRHWGYLPIQEVKQHLGADSPVRGN